MRGQGSVFEERGADAELIEERQGVGRERLAVTGSASVASDHGDAERGIAAEQRERGGRARRAAARDDHVEPPRGGPPDCAHAWSAPRSPVGCQDGSFCRTAIHWATTPAGAIAVPLLEWGIVRTIVPAIAGRWFTPLGQGATT